MVGCDAIDEAEVLLPLRSTPAEKAQDLTPRRRSPCKARVDVERGWSRANNSNRRSTLGETTRPAGPGALSPRSPSVRCGVVMPCGTRLAYRRTSSPMPV
jgi:hypothetical protein